MAKKDEISVALLPEKVIANSDNQSQAIESMILNIRGKQVMLDYDLAMLYGVTTKVLIRQ